MEHVVFIFKIADVGTYKRTRKKNFQIFSDLLKSNQLETFSSRQIK